MPFFRYDTEASLTDRWHFWRTLMLPRLRHPSSTGARTRFVVPGVAPNAGAAGTRAAGETLAGSGSTLVAPPLAAWKAPTPCGRPIRGEKS